MKTGLSFSPRHTLSSDSWELTVKEKKEDKGVTCLASPFRQQEKETGFKKNVNMLFYKLNNVSLKVSATLFASITA